MKEEHTIKLLKECDSGVKMAIESFDLVLKYLDEERLKELINKAKYDHLELKRRIDEELNIYYSQGKNPNMFISELSKIKMKIELSFNDSINKISSIVLDGCNMGIKSLSMYKNKYEEADKKCLDICNDIIYKEEILAINLRRFL